MAELRPRRFRLVVFDWDGTLADSTALIAEAAYFRAQKRGFEPGRETDDWLAAEAEVDAQLLRGAAGTQA